TQTFNGSSRLDATATDAVSGGTQYFYDASSLNATVANAVSGGTQYFEETNSLNASAANAVSGGVQNFNDDSRLNATATDAVSGGTQTFNGSSRLDASAADAVSGGSIALVNEAFIDVNANNALSKGARIIFHSLNAASKLKLNGYSTMVGAIHSQVAGGGVIENTGSSAAVLTVDSSQHGDSVFSGVIQDGTGVLGLAKTGAGTLTLSGANLYSNGTSINGGTLVANHNNALGSGAVNVSGSGTLQVNSGVVLTNALNLSAGGTLSGTGTVGITGSPTAVQSGASMRGGDDATPYGTLTVAGDLDMQTGAILQVRVDPTSNQASLVNVNGIATLTGSSVQHVGNVVDAASDFQTGVTYTILTANQITGRFQSAASNYAYLNATLDYLDGAQEEVTDPLLNATEVTLTLQRKAGVGFADLAGTANQVAAANAIESLPSTHPVHQYLETLPAGAPEAALNGLSGDTHAHWQSGLHAPSARASRSGPQRMHNNLTAGYRPGAAIAQSDGPLPASAWPTSKALPAWAEVVGHRQSVDGDGNAAKLTQNVYGLFIGADEEVGSNGWRVGGSLGFTTADAQVKARDASADISSYSASVYTGKGFSHGMNRVNVLGGLAYTHHRISSERSVTGLGQNLKAKYNANTLQLFGEVGYAMGQYSKQGMEPFAGINITQQRVGSFQESGGFAALRGQSSSDITTSTTLGVRAHSEIKLAGKDARLKGTVGWRHAWGDVSQSSTLSFEGSSSFTVAGAPLARNTALLGLQAEVELSRRAALELGYQGEYGSGMRDHAVNVKMRWAY
nr:autotransporter domain-containing protein [Comamonas sp.]